MGFTAWLYAPTLSPSTTESPTGLGDAKMASTVMACYIGEVRPGYNRHLLAVMEWGKREALARGWRVHYKGRIRKDGRQVVDVYVIADL